MAKKKFYAVRQGRKTGMFLTWDECKKQVMGVSRSNIQKFWHRSRSKRVPGNWQ